MQELKIYRRNAFLLLCVILLSYMGHLAKPLPILSRRILEGICWLSLISCFGVITSGVIKFSQKIGKLAYFFVLGSLISSIFAFKIETINSINVISFYIYYICLFASLITGVIAIVKEEKGLAKLSGFILMLIFGLIFMCTFIVWNMSGTRF
ncbi:hypothetical protein CN692_15185 [Bacillus sp. AFS002410]|uniref:hypothetical protein n=1 Tax=Bacillus sp. AFS002410 TaxID=2033481 RepID=UPI000BEFCFF6|nr:hypothetical protein [Bacillus sp. AFS002410]PEJ56930.1 hypothetical protein CN692_15185 [Bacillus sp. AFS002410]